MRTEIRIVSGEFRGRKVTCNVNPALRPTPQMAREALFSILGNAVPDRPFIDVFAGTGVVGLEALSRGARSVTFVERDFRLIADLERHIKEFDVAERATIVRTDVYRWIERWQAPAEPACVFLSPPFPDFESRREELFGVCAKLQQKVSPGSVVILQAEEGVPLDDLADRANWDQRIYGRNHLLFWVKEAEEAERVESPPP